LRSFDTFEMSNRQSPLAAGTQVRRALNAESLGLGHFSKRRGICTTKTIDLTVGSTSPYTIIPWTLQTIILTCGKDVSGWAVGDRVYNDTGNGDHWQGVVAQLSYGSVNTTILVRLWYGYKLADINDNVADGIQNLDTPDTTTLGAGAAVVGPDVEYLVACGSDAIAFVNPYNNYLYSRTAAGVDSIGSHPSSSTDIDSGWGLTIPVQGGTPLYTDNVHYDTTSHKSSLDGGTYAVAIASYNEGRNVVGPPLFIQSETGGTSDHLQPVPGAGYSIEWSAAASTLVLDTKTSHARIYIERMQAVSASGTWLPYNVSRYRFHGLHCVIEEAVANTAAYHPAAAIDGDEPGDALLDYATTLVPYCPYHAEHDGRRLYGNGLDVYYSNPNCPETYAGRTTANNGPVTPTLGITESGLIRGEAHLTVNPDGGTLTGFVSYADEVIALCQYGSWQLLRLSDGVSYGRSQHMFGVGCIAPATVRYTPWGAMWLERSGIGVWTGSGAPVVLTRRDIDLYGGEIDAGSDLSGAFAAFDFKRNQYIVVIPTDAKSGTCTGVKDNGTSTVTATTPEFTEACVGRTLVIAAVGSFAITDFLGPTQVTVTGDASGASGAAFTIAAGQTVLVLQADMLDAEKVVVRQWKLAHTHPVIGLGYSHSLGEVIWLFDSAPDYAQVAADGVYKDIDATTGTTYAFGLDIFDRGDTDEVVVRPKLLVRTERETPGQEQTMTVNCRGMLSTATASGSEHTGTLTWAADEHEAKDVDAPVSGPLIRWQLRNTDAYGMDIVEIGLGTMDADTDGRRIA